MRRTRRTIIAMAVAAMSPLFAFVPPSVAAAEGRHCVTRLETGYTACFATFTEAVSVATGGLIDDAPDDASIAFTSSSFKARVEKAGESLAARPANANARGAGTLAAVTLSFEYDRPYYDTAGGSWQITAGSGCDSDPGYEHGYPSLIGTGWNNIISSFIGYGACQVEHWTSENYVGDVNYGSYDDVFPAVVDNQTSSLHFY